MKIGSFILTLMMSNLALADGFREEVRTVIKKSLPEITQCYTQALQKDSTLKGKVVLNWDINDQGKAEKVEAKSTDLKNDETLECIKSKVAKQRFPAAPKGEIANVGYPFQFGGK
jgi:hypothetical protein